MAYSTSRPPSVFNNGGLYSVPAGSNLRNAALWIYTSPDPWETVKAANYFSNAQALGMQVADLVIVVDTTNNTTTLARCTAVGASGATLAPFQSQDPVNFRNILDGGDFTVNPWQRNVPGLQSSAGVLSGVTNTLTYFADRWFGVGGASSSITMSQVQDSTLAGTSQHLKFQRANANANTAVLNLGQAIETLDAYRCQGQPVTLSFYAKAGANFSPANGTIGVQVFAGTGTNQSAANMVAGTWTGQSNVVNATAALTTAWQRFQFTGTVPAGATQLGVLFTMTPVGTAGSDDSFTIDLVQLEVGPSATVPERRDVQVELEICQRYAWVIAEPASGVVVGMGACPTTTTASIYMATPVQMLKAPTLTVSAGTFNVRPANAAASGTAAAGGTHTPNAITVSVSAVTATTAGFATPLLGGGGTGYIVASADF